VKISEAMSKVGLLYVETSPFIYFTEKRPIYVDKIRMIFRLLDERRLDVMTSTITLSESLTKPLKDQDIALVNAYTDLFETTIGLSMMPVDAVIARRSAEMRATYGLKTPDALHGATALTRNCGAF
jgi:predicted nucleic acid-binding protein